MKKKKGKFTEAQKKKITNALIDGFNFDKVHKAMEAVGWRYFDSADTPTKERLVQTATEEILTVLNDPKVTGASTGGFTARYIGDAEEEEPYMELTFTVASSFHTV